MTDASGDSRPDRTGRSARRSITRRDLLGALSVAGTAVVAGCQSVLSGGSGVEPSWEYDIESAWATSPPAMVDGTVVVGAQDKALHAVDAGSGERRSRVETGGWIDGRPAVPSTPAGTDGATPIAHAHSADGDLYGVSLDGGVEWHVEGNRPDALTARAGGVVVHSPRGETATSTDTVAYSASDGEELWRHGASAHRVHPAPDRAIVHVHDPTNVERHFLAAIDTTDGSVAWQTDPAAARSVVGIDGDLAVLAGPGGVSGVRTSDRSERWSVSLDGNLGYLNSAGVSDHVYLALEAEDREHERLIALDSTSGERQWSERIQWGVEGIAATDQGVFVARYRETDDGSIIRVIALDSDGDRQWATDTGQGTPDQFTATGSTLLVNLGHAVHAIDVESGDRRWRHSPDSSHVQVVADAETVYASHTGEGRVLALPL